MTLRINIELTYNFLSTLVMIYQDRLNTNVSNHYEFTCGTRSPYGRSTRLPTVSVGKAPFSALVRFPTEGSLCGRIVVHFVWAIDQTKPTQSLVKN